MIFLGYEPGTKGYRFLWNNRSIYVETTATFVENLFPNCPEEKLKKKIDIPEPIHPSQEEATGNNDDNNHQPPPDDLEFPPLDPPQPGDGHINGDSSKGDTTKPQSPSQRPPKPTVEDVTDDDTQVPQGGNKYPGTGYPDYIEGQQYDYTHPEEELGLVFNRRTQSWEYPPQGTQPGPSQPRPSTSEP